MAEVYIYILGGVHTDTKRPWLHLGIEIAG